MLKLISQITKRAISTAITTGLAPLRKHDLMTGVDWADRYFKLPAGSSQVSGQWETLPYQVVPLNLMTTDLINEFNWQKSARIGYTKLAVAATFYYIEHKGRNPVIYQPTDDDAKDFTVDEIDGAIEDMPAMQAIFPAHNSNCEHNTVKKKYFSGKGVTLDIKGITSPKNARRITKQVVIRDEIDAWKQEIGGEGCPIKLTRTRLEGAHSPKEINGTTPTNAGESHIEKLMAGSNWTLRFYLPCPHCGGEQHLQWGGKTAKFGMKWDNSLVDDFEAFAMSVHYVCEHCRGKISYKQLRQMEDKGRWKTSDGIYTTDGLTFYSAVGQPIKAKAKIGIYLNALYSLTLSFGWAGLVREWLDCQSDPLKLKAFINLVLGELYEDRTGEMIDATQLFNTRREFYAAEVPNDVLVLTAGIDTQDDRYEISVFGWGENEECWLISHRVFTGAPDSEQLKSLMETAIHRTFTRADGAKLGIIRVCWDSGGHYTSTVYEMSKRMGAQWVLPIIGARVNGKPISTMPRKRNKNKVYLTEVGTDAVKEILTHRLPLVRGTDQQPKPYAIHFPANPVDAETATDEYFKQLCGFRKKVEYKKGRKAVRWTDTGYVRVEAGDCFVYAYAALNVCQVRFGLDLNALAAQRNQPKPKVDFAALGKKLGG